ncbi:MAG: pantoate--beta-alanine ligase [Proteobacteria bacterium]|nr:pantoate--beta-alanine ligase [Pseudomonadota bacterium]MBU1686581.1 pantoate--beta-alanine ligase [Pseudomonadota bacterium]
MKIISTPAEIASWSVEHHAAGETISLVPTMGFFHEGHLQLMRQARALADLSVVSLFVNPIQFGPGEDLDRYPRDFPRDASLAEQEGVEVLFAPEAGTMYPAPALTRIQVSQLTEYLCGADRPGHFDGVCTVVAKLFNLIKPEYAVFGRKDYQQLAVIRRMVSDLNWDVLVVDHPIVRETDGLAMSSRNKYLSISERQTALCLSRAIRLARRMVREGLRDCAEMLSGLKKMIATDDSARIEYLMVVDKGSLIPQSIITPDSLLALAVRVGSTRLIDNTVLFDDEE